MFWKVIDTLIAEDKDRKAAVSEKKVLSFDERH